VSLYKKVKKRFFAALRMTKLSKRDCFAKLAMTELKKRFFAALRMTKNAQNDKRALRMTYHKLSC
jgi:hypothetical protein